MTNSWLSRSGGGSSFDVNTPHTFGAKQTFTKAIDVSNDSDIALVVHVDPNVGPDGFNIKTDGSTQAKISGNFTDDGSNSGAELRVSGNNGAVKLALTVYSESGTETASLALTSTTPIPLEMPLIKSLSVRDDGGSGSNRVNIHMDPQTGNADVIVPTFNVPADQHHFVFLEDNHVFPGTNKFSADVWITETNKAFLSSTSVPNNSFVNIVPFTAQAGRAYIGRYVLFVDDATAADGLKFDILVNDILSGLPTPSNLDIFNMAISSNIQGATLGVSISDAPDTPLTLTAMNGTGKHCIIIEISLSANTASQIMLRAATNTYTAESPGGTIYPASYLSFQLGYMP